MILPVTNHYGTKSHLDRSCFPCTKYLRLCSSLSRSFVSVSFSFSLVDLSINNKSSFIIVLHLNIIFCYICNSFKSDINIYIATQTADHQLLWNLVIWLNWLLQRSPYKVKMSCNMKSVVLSFVAFCRYCFVEYFICLRVIFTHHLMLSSMHINECQRVRANKKVSNERWLLLSIGLIQWDWLFS